MTEDKKKIIIEVANYIIKNNATINEVAMHFNKSTSSIKKYINDEDNLKSIDINLYNNVKSVQRNIEKNGQIKGGYIGKRGKSNKYTDEQILVIAKDMIARLMTLEEASEVYSIPSSTLYDQLMNIEDINILSNIRDLFESNKSNAFNNKKIK